MHQKINEMPKTWPIARKGSKYIAMSNHDKYRSVPLLFIIRDMLKLAKNRKEVKYMLLNSEIKVNNKIRKDEKFPINVLDVITLEKIKKNYRLEIVNKKFKLNEIAEKDKEEKIIKIIGKRLLAKNKVQANLEYGNNFLIKDNFSIGDSVILDTKQNKIKQILQLKEGAKVEIVSGKHAGEKGKLKKIIALEKGKKYDIELKDKIVSLPMKTIIVIK
ncbi:MAG: 30S ribosomal protein S4e [Nanoarchaeota archaeon]